MLGIVIITPKNSLKNEQKQQAAKAISLVKIRLNLSPFFFLSFSIKLLRSSEEKHVVGFSGFA